MELAKTRAEARTEDMAGNKNGRKKTKTKNKTLNIANRKQKEEQTSVKNNQKVHRIETEHKEIIKQ